LPAAADSHVIDPEMVTAVTARYCLTLPYSFAMSRCTEAHRCPRSDPRL
jgi:hypothetical protein